MNETNEMWRGYRKHQQDERARRRARSAKLFSEAAELAEKNGMHLRQVNRHQYQLIWDAGGLVNIYPGNCRLYLDKKRPPTPYLNIRDEWDLMDVVRAAIRANTGET